MIYLFYLITIGLFIYGFLLWRRERRQQIQSRLDTVFQVSPISTEKVVPAINDLENHSFSKRLVRPLIQRIKRYFKKNLTSEQKESLEMKLLQAGSPLKMTPVEYRIFQLLFICLAPLLFGGYAFLLNLSNGPTVLFFIAGILIGVYFPSYYLKLKMTARNKNAIKELPDFLDLVTVSIEAGLGFDGALTKVVAKKNGVLSSEFQRCLEEMRLGKTRREALSGVRNRLVIDDVKSLIGSIIQAEQLGIGMVQILRVQSNEIREKRKQRAEETAMKAPIKMLFPLVLFIFPCLFIVLLGPAVIQFIQEFTK